MISNAIDLIHEKMPKFDKVLAEGLAFSQLKDLHIPIHSLMKSVLCSDTEPNLPKDFNYVTYEVLDPLEEYLTLVVKKSFIKGKKSKSRSKNKNIGYDMTLNDNYLVRYKFMIGGVEYPRYLLVPFVRRGGITHIRGTKYGISPVLKTRGISTTDKGFFIAFQSSMVPFEWENHVFYINGRSEHVYMPYSCSLHHNAPKTAKSYLPAIAVWLFGKWGPREAFQKYLNVDVFFHDIDDPQIHEYDTDIYAVCTGSPASKNKFARFVVVIAKADLSPEAKIMIGTMFYVGGRQSDRVNIDNIESNITWQILLGVAISKDKNTPNHTMIADIQTHFGNIEKMLDTSYRMELITEGIEVEDIYELLFHIIRAFTKRDSANNAELASLWGKYYTCIEYVTLDVRRQIYNAHWKLINQATDQVTRKGGGIVKKKNIENTLNKLINISVLQGINNGHGEVNAFMTTTDNMILGLTSHCIDQTDANKANSKKSINLNSPMNHLHASFCEIGSVCNLPKSNPIGPYRINMCQRNDEKGKATRSSKYPEIMRDLAADINLKGI